MSKLIPETPIYYMGKKYNVIKYGLIDLFPNDINTLYEPFCGSCIVSYNTKAKKYVLNDLNKQLVDMINMFKQKSTDSVLKDLHEYMNLFNLEICIAGGSFNTCSKNFNKKSYDYHYDAYLKLRDEYNRTHNIELLYLLTIYCFSHQMRFNSAGEFNMPVGPNKYTKETEQNIKEFSEWLKNNDVKIFNKSYLDLIQLSELHNEDFVYLDPPYYGTVATYNERNQWELEDDLKLFDFCNMLTQNNVKWGMSNVILGKNNNQHLLDWIKSNNYNIHVFDKVKYVISYDVEENENRKEIFITNY